LPQSILGYDVVSKLGEGAASKIYVVTDSSNQLYALKHVIRETEKHDRFIEQVMNEFEVGKLFRHPALRRIVDLKLNRRLLGKPTEAALVMELIDGTPLDDRPPASMTAFFDIFRQAAVALSAMHYQRIVHCDVKPHNMLRCGDETLRIIDFGQACPFGTSKPRVQGTPDYIAPEQVKCRPVDARTDIYNFGATLYWALTGRRVPTYITVEKTERHIVKKQHFPSPRELNAGVSESLSDLVMKCVRYYPDDRPDSFAKVMAVMELCEQEAIHHQPA
jgi:serine/threonine-protein kinase